MQGWIDRNFATIDSLYELKTTALDNAKLLKMSDSFIEEIQAFFFEYEKKGFFATINGLAGQTLKIMDECCIITTDSEHSREKLLQEFYSYDYDYEMFDDGEDFTQNLTAADKKRLTQSLLSGRIIQASIGAAMSASINQHEKELHNARVVKERQKRRERLISVGERYLDLNNIESIEMHCIKRAYMGYLKFVPKGVSTADIYDCEYFFFNNAMPFENKRIRQKIDLANSKINERLLAIADKKKKALESTRLMEEKSKLDVFSEMRKYKELLDEGIISEDEFAQKKKKLLDL